MNKPFGIGELMARIRTALRRNIVASGEVPIYRSGDLVVDTLAHRVTLKDVPVKLTPKEFDLLELLVRHAGRVLTHRQILTEVWGPAHVDDAQYLRVFVRKLRQSSRATMARPASSSQSPASATVSPGSRTDLR